MYFEDNSEVVLTKVVLFSVKTLTVRSEWHTVCTVHIKPLPWIISPDFSLYTVQVTHQLKKEWSWSHALLLPTTHRFVKVVHELVQKEIKESSDCFCSALVLRVRGSTSLSHLPASTSRPGVSRTHCCKHCCFSHTCFFSLIIWGRWKEVKDALKTKRLQALWSVTTEQHQAASGNVYAQHFFTEETQLSWPVEPGGKKITKQKLREGPLSSKLDCCSH